MISILDFRPEGHLLETCSQPICGVLRQKYKVMYLPPPRLIQMATSKLLARLISNVNKSHGE